jgi:methionyl-tRNA formyltransferase
MDREMKIIFMGTPEFAVPSLDVLVKNGYHIVAVVTAPDKPAGRGRKIKYSPVKEYALEKQIPVMQPTHLKGTEFIEELKSCHADLQIVVAFRMLPEIVWKMPSRGTFNLHASLLPQYRGAAPINWAIINGETETGITTFFIDEKIDTGRIILREKIKIEKAETAGELHDRLMVKGSELVLKTVKAIEEDLVQTKPQKQLVQSEIKLKSAPKIFKEDTRIDWEKPKQDVFNLIRGLSPYPGAYTKLISPGNESWIIKIFKSELVDIGQDVEKHRIVPGIMLTDQKTYLYIGCGNGIIGVKEIQLEGKRRMNIAEFLRGFNINSEWNAGN